MNVSWPRRRMKDLCSISSSKRIHAREYLDDGVPFYRGKEIIEKQRGALVVSTDIFISKKRFLEIKAKNGAPAAGDLLLTSVGTLGIPYVVSQGEQFYFKDGNLTWFREFKNIFSKYLYYWLLSPAGNAELKKCTIGSSQQAFTIVLLKDMEIDLPPLPTQCRIASILSAYDDLIENNTRRIAILEEMARRIYEEWFVQFRFPGHEDACNEETLPMNWRLETLGNIAAEIRDTVHPSQISGETPYVGLEHIPRRSITLNEWSRSGTVASNKLIFRHGDILFGKIRPYFHKVVVAPIDGVCSSDTIVLRPRSSKFFALTLCCASSDSFVKHATQTSNGTKMPRANWKVLRAYPVVIPDDELLINFNKLIQDIVSQTQTLMFKNSNLRAQRDLLLPQLISGEIDVSNLPLPGTEDEAA